MTKATITYDGNKIIEKLIEWKVDPKPGTNQIDVIYIKDSWVKFRDGAQGAGNIVSRAILAHPNANVSLATAAVKVARQHQLPVTFAIDDALAYEKVFVIDPNAAFNPNDLLMMVNNNIALVMISGNTGTVVKQNLEAALNGD